MAPITSATPFQIMKSIIVKLEKSTNSSKPAMCGLFYWDDQYAASFFNQ